jgi:hypothetical protein
MADESEVVMATLEATQMLEVEAGSRVTAEPLPSIRSLRVRYSLFEKTMVLATVLPRPGIVAFSVNASDYIEHAIDPNLSKTILRIMKLALL